MIPVFEGKLDGIRKNFIKTTQCIIFQYVRDQKVVLCDTVSHPDQIQEHHKILEVRSSDLPYRG